MSTIKVTIGKSKDLYGAYSDDAPGIWGEGKTVAEVKQSFYDAIDLFIEFNEPENVPAILKGEYKIEWKFEVESLISHYKGIFTSAALERLTGINQGLLSHYATGMKKPRPAQKKKIEDALHNLGAELLAVEL
jgi:predicted RNase H-like HicB family nuclease